MKLIPLSGKHGAGHFAAVSDEDSDYLSQWSWYLHQSKSCVYVSRSAYRDGVRVRLTMHREVGTRMGLSLHLQIDHRNGDTLDNCRHALRSATQQQNQANRAVSRTNKLGIKGVYLTASRRYRAEIESGGRRYRLGYFDDAESAAAAYRDAAFRLHGEFARVG